jgi:hypothetical protein
MSDKRAMVGDGGAMSGRWVGDEWAMSGRYLKKLIVFRVFYSHKESFSARTKKLIFMSFNTPNKKSGKKCIKV